MLAIVLVRLAVIAKRPRSEFGLLLGSNFYLTAPESQLDNSGARLVFQIVVLLLFCPLLLLGLCHPQVCTVVRRQ